MHDKFRDQQTRTEEQRDREQDRMQLRAEGHGFFAFHGSHGGRLALAGDVQRPGEQGGKQQQAGETADQRAAWIDEGAKADADHHDAAERVIRPQPVTDREAGDLDGVSDFLVLRHSTVHSAQATVALR